jgi:hypothetical protein
MTAISEGAHPGEFILSEANGHRSRENATLITGQNLGAGAVLGKITATGKYTGYDNGAGDGSQAAAGILYAAVDATNADMDCVVIVRHAEVIGDALDFDAGMSGADQTAATADLLALGIIVR